MFNNQKTVPAFPGIRRQELFFSGNFEFVIYVHLKPPCHNDLRQFQCGISVYILCAFLAYRRRKLFTRFYYDNNGYNKGEYIGSRHKIKYSVKSEE